MAEGARFESVWAGNGLQSSNLCLSATPRIVHLMAGSVIRTSVSAALFALSVQAASAYGPATRSEKDGFVIDVASNGGNCTGCEWIVIDGKIPIDADKLLEAWIRKSGYADIPLAVVMNSNGGNLVGGIRLGQAIRRLGLKTEIGRTTPDPDVPTNQMQGPGGCYSACAYAFLGGVRRTAVSGTYGVHQFYSDAYFDAPAQKAFTAIDLSGQQALTGVILAYVVEMGADPQIVVAANRMRPDEIFKPSEDQLRDWKIGFEPDAYGKWQIEPYRDGIVLFSRTQNGRSQISLTCGRSGAELLLTRKGLAAKYVDDVVRSYGTMESFSLFDRVVPRTATRITKTADGLVLRISLSKPDLEAMQGYRSRSSGLSAGPNEPHSNMDMFNEDVPIEGLERHVRLLRRNCAS